MMESNGLGEKLEESNVGSARDVVISILRTSSASTAFKYMRAKKRALMVKCGSNVNHVKGGTTLSAKLRKER